MRGSSAPEGSPGPTVSYWLRSCTRIVARTSACREPSPSRRSSRCRLDPFLSQVARQVIQPYHAAPLPFHDGRRSTQPNPVERPDKCIVWQLCRITSKAARDLPAVDSPVTSTKPARLHGRLQRRALISGNERRCIGASSAGIRVGRGIDPDLDRIGDLPHKPALLPPHRIVATSLTAIGGQLRGATIRQRYKDHTGSGDQNRDHRASRADTAVSTAASKAAPATSHQPLKRRHRNLYTATAPFLAAWSYAPSGNGPHRSNPSSRTVRVTARSESTRPAHRAVCAAACVTGERCPE